MIYLPAIYDEWEWQRVNRLLLSDPILYAWLYWNTQATLESMYTPLEIRRKEWDLSEEKQIPLMPYRFGFNTNPPI